MTSRRKQFWISIPLLIIGLSAIVFVLSNIIREHGRTRGIDADIAKQRERASEIAQENAMLEKTISYLESEEARQFNARKLGYGEEDQKVVGVSDIATARKKIEEGDRLGGEGEEVVTDALLPIRQWYKVFFEKEKE